MNSGEKERARPLFICARWEDSVTFKRAFTFLASTDAKTMHNRTWGDDFTRSLTKAEERGKVKTKGESRTSESSLQIAVDNTTLHDLGITYRYSVLSTSLRTPPSSPALPSDVMPSSPAPTYLSFAVYSKSCKNATMEEKIQFLTLFLYTLRVSRTGPTSLVVLLLIILQKNFFLPKVIFQ